MIERSRVRVPAGAAGEFSSPGSTFCSDSYFVPVAVFTPVLTYVKDPGHCAKSAGGMLQLNTHAPYAYVSLYEVTWCMVVWCTQNAPRRQQSHAALAVPAL